VQLWLETGAEVGWSEGFTEAQVREHFRGPIYDVNGTRTRMGRWGGMSAFQAIANILNIDICVWNEVAADSRVPTLVQQGDRQSGLRMYARSMADVWSRLELGHIREAVPLVHVEFNGTNHYAACRPHTTVPPTLPMWLSTAGMAVQMTMGMMLSTATGEVDAGNVRREAERWANMSINTDEFLRLARDAVCIKGWALDDFGYYFYEE